MISIPFGIVIGPTGYFQAPSGLPRDLVLGFAAFVVVYGAIVSAVIAISLRRRQR